MKKNYIVILNKLVIVAIVLCCNICFAQEANSKFDGAADTISQQLKDAIEEQNELREEIKNKKIPLSTKLNNLEADLISVRLDYKEVSRTLDNRILDLTNLRREVKQRQDEASYMSNLFGDYINNLKSRMHIAEHQRYAQQIESTQIAMDNRNLPAQEVYHEQIKLLMTSLDRLEGALNGDKFAGHALDESGKLQNGEFVMMGPAAIFRSEDGSKVGAAQQKLGSLEPAIISYGDPQMTTAAEAMVSSGEGFFPLDPTGGNARKIEETQETIIDQIKKGGPVMYPILGMAAISMLIALIKWLSMIAIRKPSQKRIDDLLFALSKHDISAMKSKVQLVVGPVGKMLTAGVEHIREPRELIEEVMYETVLATRLRLQKMLPFIAICASSAPLLGLLGTVTGIINTFKLITVFGSGDVKTLSGGISEALITTMFGLIVAIPSLLLHAFLSRKAKAVIDQMEKAAVAFVNQVSKSHYEQEAKKIEQPVTAMAASTGETDSQQKTQDKQP